jgi:hypothetical protein
VLCHSPGESCGGSPYYSCKQMKVQLLSVLRNCIIFMPIRHQPYQTECQYIVNVGKFKLKMQNIIPKIVFVLWNVGCGAVGAGAASRYSCCYRYRKTKFMSLAAISKCLHCSNFTLLQIFVVLLLHWYTIIQYFHYLQYSSVEYPCVNYFYSNFFI